MPCKRRAAARCPPESAAGEERAEEVAGEQAAEKKQDIAKGAKQGRRRAQGEDGRGKLGLSAEDPVDVEPQRVAFGIRDLPGEDLSMLEALVPADPSQQHRYDAEEAPKQRAHGDCAAVSKRVGFCPVWCCVVHVSSWQKGGDCDQSEAVSGA